MTYTITNYTRARARALGVQVKPSTRKGKKLDVFKDGKKVASVGALGYKDFPTFKRTEGNDVANKRRKAYRARHQGEQLKVGSPGYYAWFLLW